MPPTTFALGFDPTRAAAARALMLSGPYGVVSEDAPIPPAWSLSKYKLRDLMQGQCGSCWLHSATQLFETSAAALGYKSFPACRRLIGWVGQSLTYGRNLCSGGDPTDALLSMTKERGAGVAHEELCPYTDSSWENGRKPPQKVFDDAKNTHLVMPVDVRSDDDARRLIAGGHGACNGIWWPSGWDASKTFMDSVGGGGYGHSLYEMGYVQPGVWPGEHGRYDWWQLDNWHTLLYPPLPPEFAEKVPGYKPSTPTRTSDFWVRGDVYRRVQAYGSFVRVSATDATGLERKLVIPKFIDSFPA